jgi:hypothetical protein
LQVASQSYVFNSGIKAMATTNTARGLTQKQIMGLCLASFSLCARVAVLCCAVLCSV